MNNLRRVGINMISGGAGYIIPMAINVFSTPYVINTLGKEAFGLQALANVIIGYLVVADMGLDIPITRRIAEYYAKNLKDYQSKFLVGTIKIYFLIGAFGMLLVLLFTNKLITLLGIPPNMHDEARIVFYMTSLGFMGSIINMWGKAVFNGIHRYDIANAVSVLNNLFGVVVGILLITKGYGVIGFFFARVIGFLLSNVAYLFLARRYITNFNLFPFLDLEIWHYLKKQIGYGFTLRMSGMIFSKMDQTLISSWIGVATVAVYSIPILIANTLSGLIASITHFAFPMASAMNTTHSHKDLESFFTKISKFITFISTLVFIPFLVLGDKFLTLWINPEVSGQGQGVLFLLLIAFYINACFNIGINPFMVGIGQLKIFTLYSICRSVLLFIGFFILIKLYGLEGAGISYLFSLISDLIFFFYSLRKKLNYNVLSLLKNAHLKPMVLGLLLGALMIPFRDSIDTWIELIASYGVFSVLYIAISFKIDIVGQTERKAILALLKRG